MNIRGGVCRIAQVCQIKYLDVWNIYYTFAPII